MNYWAEGLPPTDISLLKDALNFTGLKENDTYHYQPFAPTTKT